MDDEQDDQPRTRLARAATRVAETASDVVETASDVVSTAGAAAGRLFEGSRETRLRKLNRTPIPNLFELHPEARSAARRNMGLMTIPVAEVLGTAVEGPAQRGADFTPLPRLKGANWRQRWQRLKAAQDRLAILPPIDVLHAGGGYWIVDGHNRVALALLIGQEDIDANVTHVHLPGTDDANLPTGSLQTVLADSQELRLAANREGTHDHPEAPIRDPDSTPGS